MRPLKWALRIHHPDSYHLNANTFLRRHLISQKTIFSKKVQINLLLILQVILAL